MEGVDGGAFERGVVGSEPARHHRPEDAGFGQPRRIVARHQHDLPAPRAPPTLTTVIGRRGSQSWTV
jgi:hypothetical protein